METPDKQKKLESSEEESEDDKEVKSNMIIAGSPPRSPSPERSAENNGIETTDKEKTLDSSEEESEDDEEVKSNRIITGSPPRSPSPERSAESSGMGTTDKQKKLESSSEESEDELEVKSNRIITDCPPRSPSPERSAESSGMGTTDKQKKLESSSEESEDELEVKSNRIITDCPPRSPSPERSVENSTTKATREELNSSAIHVEGDGRDMKGSSSDEEDSDNDDRRKCVRAASPPRSPSPVRSCDARIKEAVEQNEKRIRRTRQSSSDEESEEENEQLNHTKEVSPPRSPSPRRRVDESIDNTSSEKNNKATESLDEDSDEDDAVTRRKCLRMMTPPRSPSPVRSADPLTHTDDLLKQKTEVTKSGSNAVRIVRKHKLPSQDESSDEENDGPGIKVKCVRLGSPPRSPSPPPDTVEYMDTGRISRRTAHSSRKAGLDLSLKPKHRVSSKENCDTCDSDSDEDDDNQSGSEVSIHLPSPVSIRSPTPPPIMSPDYETTAIDLSVKHDSIMHPVPDYTDGPRDQKEYNERSDQTVVVIPSEHGLLPPGCEEDDAMDVSDYTSYDPLEDVPGVINLATTRRGKKSASHRESKRSVSSGSVGDDGGQDHAPPNKRPGRKPDKSGNGNNPPSKSSKKSKSPCTGLEKYVLTPADAPPSRESVITDILPLGLSQENHQDAFFSDPTDVPERPR